MVTRSPIYPTVRKMHRRDIKKVSMISRHTLGNTGYRPADVVKHMSTRRNDGLIAEYREDMLGYCTYSLKKEKTGLMRRYCVIDHLVVRESFRRREVGSSLLENLLCIGSDNLCDYYLCLCPYTDSFLSGALFLESAGFYLAETRDDSGLMLMVTNTSRFTNQFHRNYKKEGM